MDKMRRITPEGLLYGLIFIGALAARLILLGRPPLLEGEAGWAYQAWQISQGEPIQLGSQVSYLAVTEALFSLLGSSNFLARFWPALAGSLAVWIPCLLRREIKPLPALVMAAGLAFDPTLVAVSRLAGGPIPGMVFLGLGLAAFHTSRLPWAVFFAGLGMLSGGDFWLGAALLGLGTLVSRLTGTFRPGEYFRDRIEGFRQDSSGDYPRLIIPVLLVGLLATFFLADFQGVSAWVGGLPEFLGSLLANSGISPLQLGIDLLISSPLVLVFGLMGFASAWRSGDRVGKSLSIWWAVAFLALLAYPARQAEDLIWTSLPLWWSGAAELVRTLQLTRSTWVTYALAGVVSVLAVLNWLTFTGMVFQAGNDKALLLQLGLLAASIALVILSVVIVSAEWGWEVAWKGLAAGGLLVLGLYTVSTLSLESYLWEKDPRSIFSGGAGAGQMDLLRESIADASLTATGRPDSIQGAATLDSAALRWALRGFSGISFVDAVDREDPPPLLITSAEMTSQVNKEIYRGQDFTLSTRPGWTGSFPPDWISWTAFRFGPVVPDYIILWVRNDIYSGY